MKSRPHSFANALSFTKSSEFVIVSACCSSGRSGPTNWFWKYSLKPSPLASCVRFFNDVGHSPCSPIELCHLPKSNPAIFFLQRGHGSFKFINSSVHSLHVAECKHGLNFALMTLSRQIIHLSSSSSSSSSSLKEPLSGTGGTGGDVNIN
ncbi:hypothetical protein TrLO_g15970 [Triparma laevis f. longispina]|uniref:Uncharacterized protein n=1 Tax=Triparma laevis f. longispina TaxID=1714387 RepID=A0A9W7CPA2_9STRA|nr:hypothetical protein TrLO_g15970 [Triparma laevis f. longispina]